MSVVLPVTAFISCRVAWIWLRWCVRGVPAIGVAPPWLANSKRWARESSCAMFVRAKSLLMTKVAGVCVRCRIVAMSARNGLDSVAANIRVTWLRVRSPLVVGAPAGWGGLRFSVSTVTMTPSRMVMIAALTTIVDFRFMFMNMRDTIAIWQDYLLKITL